MKRGFYTIMAAQFFSSLADNALFVVAVEMIRASGGAEWQRAALVPMFALFYVVLAPFVGAFADSRPKGDVMFVSNGIKVIGCGLMLFGSHPLLSYAIVGLGAAAYSPAKYGILTELLPASLLVKANGWIEGLTIASIILGVLLGGQLVGPYISSLLLSVDLPLINTPIDTPPEAAICVLVLLYALAAWFNTRIPNTGATLMPMHSQRQHSFAYNLLALVQPAAVARQAGANFLGQHHLVLGCQWQPALHRVGLERGGAGLHHHPSLGFGGRDRDWHRGRRRGGLDAHEAGRRAALDEPGHHHGLVDAGDEFH